ncbi:hypothetical protein C3B44_03975 [Corynebacterium yudongzhengii]|uniref:HNH endonuclease n=1 Tax=Corynebacterium yudongzhengii TaxID=2080740 RepID=A0A2U1T6J3_9CORY|nr:HNH endonuclease signature motif containing protein [Corynebacterium yudongzhengii]AWB81624.1 hypothetical protein C3B44_03975 [Corynebacterium yudongzhengii]PWC01609.1 HNH endonuclease [Corynebacterium yudongzhengii]
MQHYKAKFLIALALFDARGLAKDAGSSTTAEWMTRALDIAPTTAYDYLRVARVLLEFAYVAYSFEQTKIGYSHVRLLSSYLTKDNEIELLLLAEQHSYRELERILMNHRDNRQDERPKENSFRMWVDKSNGRIRFSGDLDPISGAKLMAALKVGELANLVDLDDIDPEVFEDDERVHEELVKAEAEAEARAAAEAAAQAEAAREAGDSEGAEEWSSVSGYGRTAASQLVPALMGLINLARSSPVNRRRAPGTQVHVIQTEDGQSILPGLPVPSEQAVTAEIVNGQLRGHLLDDRGASLVLGRTRRLVSDAQALAILTRWGFQCAAPGCCHTQFMEFHHVIPWSQGGRTEPWNMAALCSSCHSLVTSGVIEMFWESGEPGALVFRYRTGEVYASRHGGLPVRRPMELSRLDVPALPPGSDVIELGDDVMSFQDPDDAEA